MQPLINGVLPCVLTMAAAHRAWAQRYAPWLLIKGDDGRLPPTGTVRGASGDGVRSEARRDAAGGRREAGKAAASTDVSST